MPRYARSFTDLQDEAASIGKMAVNDDPHVDATDRIAIAIYQVGAVLAERLEKIVDRLEAKQ